MGRQINYLVLPEEFVGLVRAVSRPEPALWVPQLHPRPELTLWDAESQPSGDGWLIRDRDLPRMRDQEAAWWEARKCFMFSAGGFGIEMGACFFDGSVLRRERMYFNTLPPVDPEVGRWAGKAMAAARRFLVRQPRSSIYWGPLTARWIDEGKAVPARGGAEVWMGVAGARQTPPHQ